VPVLDSRLKTHVYEIELFDWTETSGSFGPRRVCGGKALSLALDSIDPERLLGDHRAIVRIDPSDLDGGLLERWGKRLILEIPSSALLDPDPNLASRLSHVGRQWCIKEAAGPESGRAVHPAKCFVKIDITDLSEAELAQRVKELHDNRLTVIATAVESRRQFEMCTRTGLDLVMGDFYTEPPSARQKSITPNQGLLLELSAKTTQDADIRAIESIFKKNPDLAFGLMNLVHSAFYRGSEHVASIRQAIALLGYENLHKWVSLMLFSIERSDLGDNPLFEKALIRSRTMELAATKLRRKGLGSSAYISGIFSLVPALFDVPVEEVLMRANFVEEIKEALLKGSGVLGDLLEATKELEKGRYETFEPRQGLALQAVDLFGAYTDSVMEHPVAAKQPEGDPKVVSGSQAYAPVDRWETYGRTQSTIDRQPKPTWIWRLLALAGLRTRRGSTA